MVLGALLRILILQLPTIKKYAYVNRTRDLFKVMETRIRLENTETFTNMVKENPIFAERFTLR